MCYPGHKRSAVEEAYRIFKVVGWAMLSKVNAGLGVGIHTELKTS